ncbi:MAG: LamG domain-containing protein, partial [Planctomycetes bacterium]|nr:LamG domain-containing protein [Planctomycetota bacterium]
MKSRVFFVVGFLVISGFLMAGIAGADINDGLKAYWSFDDGTATDLTGHGLNGTINGAIAATGRIGPAFSFDGIDDSIEVTNSINENLAPAFTLSCWVYSRSDNDNKAIVGAHAPHTANGYFLGIRYGKFCFFVDGDPVNGFDRIFGTTTVEANRWYHVVGIYDGTKQYLFVDGV